MKRKLEGLVQLEPSLQIALEEANEKLHFIRYGEQRRLTHDRSRQTLVDAGDELSEQEAPPVSKVVSWTSEPQNTPPVSMKVQEQIQSPPESSGRRNSERKVRRESYSLSEHSVSSPNNPLPGQAPSSSRGDDEIPVPDLDPDGRVVSLHPQGVDEWDRLSDSDEEQTEFAGVRKSKPFVDVHEFLRSVSIREQKGETDPERSSDEDDDDESASVY